ncbi:MAG: Calx-beta domain-containing protein [Paludisphaera borealis]|uniref:Calx-beta domain-containing protein n=1 Tax=Paludisphaera borealis TaxID=1387353 RepID=UPI00284B92D9|nr:Calx-beta domain-containing protein [Paludisphaera borealis]MDR3621153.1 Calx-beta domain-containing protein [Paludisphaera borealis]
MGNVRKRRGTRRSTRLVFESFDLERRQLMTYGPTVASYQVNQVTEGGQYKARTTVAPNGVTTIVWQDSALDGDGSGIYARRIDASGNPLGGQFRVNTNPTGYQTAPVIGSDAQGNVLIAWKDAQLSASGINQYYQRYDATGAKVGGNVLLGSTEYADDYSLEVAPDGGFTLIQEQWYQTWFRRYDAAGTLVVDAGVPDLDDDWAYQNNSVHAFPTARTNGGVVAMTWTDLRTHGSLFNYTYDGRAMLRLIDPNGQAIGLDIQLASVAGTTNVFDAKSFWPEVTPLAAGGFLVTWYLYTGQEGSFVGQRYDDLGTPQGARITLIPKAKADNIGAVTQLKNGNLVLVTVERFNGAKPDAADFRILDATGNPITGRIPMPGLSPSPLGLLRVAPTTGAGFQVSWGVSGLNISEGEVYFQAFADMPSVGFTAGAVRLAEGGGVATIRVVRDGDASAAASVRYQTTAETATAGADFTAVSGTLTFAAGRSSADIYLPILRDALVEGDETFLVSLSQPTGLSLGQAASIRVTIADDPRGVAGPALPNVYLDRGQDGLWSWTAGAGAVQISAADPEGLTVAPDGTLYVDYGQYGLWRWAGAGLTLVNAANPQNFTVAPDGTLYVDYGQYGLWRLTAATGLTLINAADPQAFVAAADDSLYVDYGQYGLWRLTAATGLTLINAADPQDFTAAPDGSLYIDYGQYGLWRLTTATGLVKIIAADPEGFVAAPDGSLYIDFGSFGLWRMDGGGFTLLLAANPEALDVGRDGFLYIDFGASGVWRRGPSGAFEAIDPANPQHIAS